LSVVSVVSAMAGRPLPGLSPVSLLLKWQTQLLTELTSVGSSPFILQRHLWISIRLDASTTVHSVTSVPSTYVHNIQYFALLLCWMHMTDWSTYALVELDSVTIQWVRQGTVRRAT
jgi:hypothetical protein